MKNETRPSSNPANSADITADFDWMIRPCEMYKDEYKDCTSFKSRFHQYFIFGESLDCTQWKRDLDNCERWVEKHNIKARDELIASEKLRHAKRMAGHLLNDVWEDRTEPPADWNKPMPEWMKENEATYLAIKSKEEKEMLTNKSSYENRSLCVIS